MPRGIYQHEKWSKESKDKLKGRTPWNKGEMIEVLCKNCNKKCFINPSRKDRFKFCSYKCKGLWMSRIKGNGSPHYQGGRENKLPKCLLCDKTLSTMIATHCVKHRIFVRSAQGYENIKKAIRRGNNHPNWNPNREEVMHDKRNDGEYKQWRLQVYKRDNYKCRINNCDCSGRIEAHHILSWKDFLELRYKVNNGITLCQAHHPTRRAEEKRLIPFFTGLVSVSN